MKGASPRPLSDLTGAGGGGAVAVARIGLAVRIHHLQVTA